MLVGLSANEEVDNVDVLGVGRLEELLEELAIPTKLLALVECADELIWVLLYVEEDGRTLLDVPELDVASIELEGVVEPADVTIDVPTDEVVVELLTVLEMDVDGIL